MLEVGGRRAEANKGLISFASSLKRSDPPTFSVRWQDERTYSPDDCKPQIMTGKSITYQRKCLFSRRFNGDEIAGRFTRRYIVPERKVMFRPNPNTPTVSGNSKQIRISNDKMIGNFSITSGKEDFFSPIVIPAKAGMTR